MDSSILDYARFYHEFKLKNPNLNVEIEAEYLKLQDTYRTNANVAASAYYSNLDLVPGNIYISLYLSFGGGLLKRVSYDHPFEPNTKEVLKRDKVLDDEWKKRLRKAKYHLQIHEDITHLEMIRKSYQVSFAMFGVNESVYPCLARSNDNDHVMEDVSSRTRTSGNMVLRRISASPSFERKKISKKTKYNELVNLIRQWILAKADPIQSYNAEVDKEKEKVLATNELKEMFGNLDIIEEDEWEHDVYGEGVYEIDEDSAAEEAVGSAIGMDSMKLMGQAIKLEAEAEYQTRKAQEQAQEYGDNAYQSVKGTFAKFTGGQNENDEEANKK
ncbi:10330_t:CDS:2 [Funneliformis mosseae]|uniref:10330_t:CDS:1 n=1 Tax=Funneliformis mosseae TaxID=27381 RepID=A0A9N9G4I1_FUNMO|nr:10330_t:CDS:2 [Funneliformis mosseae]